MTSGTLSSPRRSSASYTNASSLDSGIGTSTQTSSFESKRLTRSKENLFTFKYGKRHHSYDPEKAPYPLSYDKEVIELEAIDHAFSFSLNNTVTMVNWDESGPPKKSLDLGCGAGMWIVNAAKQWPDCHFVGFDLVNIQLPLRVLDPSIGDRVTFMHGNFLTTKLPFEDDEFDHVHISGISSGVPENKWSVLFEEVYRVLRPGGAVEVSEEDIRFPTLPRWFTSPLRNRVRRASSVHFPDGSSRSSMASPPPSPHSTSHDHALLESLYYSVYESRFINTKPTAILPIYFTTAFRQVLSAPIINFPVPPFPPPPPLPSQRHTSSFSLSDPSLPRSEDQTLSSPRPASASFSSIVSSASASTFNSPIGSSADTSSTSVSFSSESGETRDTPTLLHRHPSMSSIKGSSSCSGGESTPPATKRSGVDFASPDDSTSIGFWEANLLIPRDKLLLHSERALAIHLYRAYQGVLACRESMWEELKDRIRNKKDALRAFGWDDDEELEEVTQSRQKFERLVERYQSDMHSRLGLWHSLAQMGWPIPAREPLSKAELLEEERIHQAMLEARRLAPEEESQGICRSARVLIGFKIEQGAMD